MRVAVMQPYFYPYMGYFRLMAAVDAFILFDCVQFPRRGRVHRTEIPDGQGGRRWLTLPLAYAPRDAQISTLEFAEGASEVFSDRVAALSWAAALPGRVRSALAGPFDVPLDYIERNLGAVAAYLGIATPMYRSSSCGVSADVRGAARVRAVARAHGATQYVNAPGGRGLYDPAAFAAEGLSLEFLAPYEGERYCMLHALAVDPADALASDAAAWVREPE